MPPHRPKNLNLSPSQVQLITRSGQLAEAYVFSLLHTNLKIEVENKK